MYGQGYQVRTLAFTDVLELFRDVKELFRDVSCRVSCFEELFRDVEQSTELKIYLH